MARHESELTGKKLTLRKYEIFDAIVETMMTVFNKYNVECYNLYSNNGTHQPNPDSDESKKNDLEERIHSDVTEQLVNFNKFPSADEISLEELGRCQQGLTNIVNSTSVFQTSMIMKIIKGFIVLKLRIRFYFENNFSLTVLYLI